MVLIVGVFDLWVQEYYRAKLSNILAGSEKNHDSCVHFLLLDLL